MNSKTPIQQSVLAKIQQHEVRMRPRIFFMLKIASIIILTVLVLVLSILICNFIFFTIRLNGHDALLSFGGSGILLFLQFFPWDLFFLDAIALFCLWLLVRQFKFGYRSPWLYALMLLLVVSVLGGAALDRATPLNDSLLHQADAGHLPPPLGELYTHSRHLPMPGSGEYRGTIASITGDMLILMSYEESTTTLVTVQIPKEGPDANEPLTVGEEVIVVGHLHNGVLQAFGIHSLDDQYGLPPAPDLPPSQDMPMPNQSPTQP
jgi:hypothetical protein